MMLPTILILNVLLENMLPSLSLTCMWPIREAGDDDEHDEWEDYNKEENQFWNVYHGYYDNILVLRSWLKIHDVEMVRTEHKTDFTIYKAYQLGGQLLPILYS